VLLGMLRKYASNLRLMRSHARFYAPLPCLASNSLED
jgi:hypothetical protein